MGVSVTNERGLWVFVYTLCYYLIKQRKNCDCVPITYNIITL